MCREWRSVGDYGLPERPELTPHHRSVDREDIWLLGDLAKQRDVIYAAYKLVVPQNTSPLDAASFLRSRAPRLSSALRFVRDDLASYPFYLYTQLAKHFPDVRRADLDQTVDKLLECISGYAVRDSESYT